jgi:hypothetical protein
MASLLRPQVLLIAYWLIMVVLAAFFLRLACTLCRTSMPTWKRAFVSVFVVTFLSYLVFDFTCYLIMRSMADVLLQVPPWYTYGFWFREPIGLKWYIVSHAGMLRFLPFIFALCAAGVLQLIVLQAEVTFRFGLLIVLLQWTATAVAGYVLGLLFGVALSTAGATLPSQSAAPAAEQAGGQAKAEAPAPAPKARSRARTGRSTPAPQAQGKAKSGQPAPAPQEATDAEKTEAAPDSLQLIQREVEEAVGAPREQLAQAGQNLKAYADSNLQEMEQELAPLIKHLPEPVQNFLAGGGWWWVLGIAGFIALLWIRSILRRLREALRTPKTTKRKKRRTGPRPARLKEDLTLVGAGYTEEGSHQVVVQGMPARLRLVILSVGNKGGGELNEEMADRVLDWIKPGLSEVAASNQPGVRVWPASYSFDGFALTLQANVPLPEPKGTKSHWVVVAGDVRMGRIVLHVGLALYTRERNSLRYLRVKGERWPSVLAIKKVPQTAAAW